MKVCTVCGNNHSSSVFDTCFRCRDKHGMEIEPIKVDTRKENNKYRNDIDFKENIIVSTTHSLEGYEIEKYIGIESAEVVAGTSFAKDFFASVSDFLGTNNRGYKKTLSNAKQTAFSILKHKAASMGGNAIVGIDIDYMEIGTMMGVIVNGTVVKVKKIVNINDIENTEV